MAFSFANSKLYTVLVKKNQLIEEEYNNSLQAYIKELENDANQDGDDGFSLAGLLYSK